MNIHIDICIIYLCTICNLIPKYILYQILTDVYPGIICMGDFHFYQSNILTQRLYFYTSMTFHSSAEL